MNQLFDAWQRLGVWKLLRYALYPLTTLVTTPIQLCRTLWAARCLLDGSRWADFPSFQIHKGLNYLFYYTRDLEFSRYGRWGVSPTSGIGDFPLSRNFQYTLLSLYGYCRYGVVAVLAWMFCWLVSHLVWVGEAGLWFPLAVTVLAAISTTFYANVFGHQNYNAAGWAVFPVGLYGVVSDKPLLAAIAFLFCSFGSFTVVTISVVFCGVLTLVERDPIPLAVVLPAVLRLSMHLLPREKGSEPKGLNPALYILKAIGFTKSSTRYVRTRSAFSAEAMISLMLYAQFPLCGLLLEGRVPLFSVIGLGLFVLNTFVARFADKQHLQMAVISAAMVDVMALQSWMMLPSFWLLASPPPWVIGFPSMPKVVDAVPALEPYDARPAFEALDKFITPVSKGEKVLFAFDDPGTSYEALFDGYRHIMELPIYRCAMKGVHFLPDWWAVFDTNTIGAASFWGRSPTEVLENVEKWAAQWVIVYQSTGTELDAVWEEQGFRIAGTADWGDEEAKAYLKGVTPWHGNTPKWWLLALPDAIATS